MPHRHASLTTAALAVLLMAAPPAPAQPEAGARWPVAGIDAPRTELALELFVTIAPRVEVGESGHGSRQYIPITGGRFAGDGIRGEVLPGGADWQLVRPDGVLEVLALYSIRTDDGATIVVDNRGIIAPGTDGAPAYVRTSPRFHAPRGRYDWLNRTVFVGTITPAEGGGAVIIRVFRVL